MDASERPARPEKERQSRKDRRRIDADRERDWIDLDAPEMTSIAAA